MTYRLFVGDYAYSSWSLRGWMLLDAFDIPFSLSRVPMYSAEFTEMQKAHAPARTVPTLQIADGETSVLVWESLAIAETLAEREPEAPIWPETTEARAAARALASEMHAGFHALRGTCPMNLRKRYAGFAADDALRADLARLHTIWDWALQKFGGPYLGGAAFSAVDAMFAPVATRLVTYGLDQTPEMVRYVAAIYATPSFRRWHAMADAHPRVLDRYDMWQAETENAGPPRIAPLAARAHDGDVADAINPLCPFSGNPIKADCLAMIEDEVIGFCNPFCRDKVVADAEAWPEVTVLRSVG